MTTVAVFRYHVRRRWSVLCGEAGIFLTELVVPGPPVLPGLVFQHTCCMQSSWGRTDARCRLRREARLFTARLSGRDALCCLSRRRRSGRGGAPGSSELAVYSDAAGGARPDTASYSAVGSGGFWIIQHAIEERRCEAGFVVPLAETAHFPAARFL